MQNYVTWILIVLFLIFLLKIFLKILIVERWFDICNYDKNDKRPLKIGVKKKVIGMFKDELGGKIMNEFCTFRAKRYTYLIEDDSETKKAKEVKR